METIELAPVRNNPAHYDDIEAFLAEFFKQEIYIPLVADLGLDPDKVFNANDSLITAIRKGTLTFENGKFTGKFSAALSRDLRKLGAKWRSNSWQIHLSKLPIDVQTAIRTSETRFQSVLDRIDKKLGQIIPDAIAEKMPLTEMFDSTLFRYEKDVNKTLKAISIKATLTHEMRRKVAEQYSDNLKIPIRDFTRKETTELREKIRRSTFKGSRYEDLIKTIQDSYGVSARKAKFLARQETNLLLASYKEARYAEAGVHEYRWKSVVGTALHPTRARHKALNDMSGRGKIFRFDDPPVTTEPGEPERRNNPGQDYNCRCVAIPVVRF